MSVQSLPDPIVALEAPEPPVNPPSRRFKCTFCQRQFNRREHLQRHISIRETQIAAPSRSVRTYKRKITTRNHTIAIYATMHVEEGRFAIPLRTECTLTVKVTFLTAM
jgi:wyosine [tRNA(Phe)-imidazoG37] synthetase (radical SAM superfamily)